MRLTRLKWIVASLSLAGGLIMGAGLLAQQPVGGAVDRKKGLAPLDPAIKALIEARVESARGVFDSAMLRYANTTMLFPDDTPDWSRRWMEDELQLNTGPAGKFAAIQGHLERTKRLEGVMDGYAKAGQGQGSGVLKMRYFRLEAEQMLAEARSAHPEIPLPKPRPVAGQRGTIPQSPPPSAPPGG